MSDTKRKYREVKNGENPSIAKEIEELLQIPEVESYFSEVLKHVRQKYKEQIGQYDHLRYFEKSHKNSTEEHVKNWSKDKTYFFDLIRIEDQDGVRWEPQKHGASGVKDTLDIILAELIKKIDQYTVSPNLIQSEIIKLPELETPFRIGFTKKSEIRVKGFINALDPEKGKEDFWIKEDSNILTISRQYKNLKRSEMYFKIKQLMKKHPELIEDIFFYSHMVLKPGGG